MKIRRQAKRTKTKKSTAATARRRRDPEAKTKASASFKLGRLVVRVAGAGTQTSPMRTSEKVFKYRVTIASPSGARYGASAWGSIRDHQQGRHAPREMGAMVVSELLSAKADPEEFMEMAGRKALPVIRKAEAFSYEELSHAFGLRLFDGLL